MDKVAALPSDPGRGGQLRRLLEGLAGSLLAFRGCAGALERLAEALDLVASKGLDGEDQDSYYEPQSQARVDEATAAKGLGEAGGVDVAASLWNKMVPTGLLQVYRTFIKSGGAQQVQESRAAQGSLSEMLHSIRTTTRGAKITRDAPTTSSFLIPKNSEKCRFIMNPVLNTADPRRPRKFRLPTLESLGRRLAVAKGTVYMTKTDLANCYWSIKLPQEWRRVFVVTAGGRRYRITRLPFGWSYSPSICQRLVSGIVRGSLRAPHDDPETYLDDILVAEPSKRRTKRVTRAATSRLRRAGFLISPKSDHDPSTRQLFVGKVLDSKDHSMSNLAGTVAAALRGWLRAALRGFTSTKLLRSLLGRLQWATRPLGGAGPFLAGSYRALNAATDRVPLSAALSRGMATSIMLACLGHRFREPTRAKPIILFADAAEEGARFRVGVVGSKGLYRSTLCPRWVRSLQQAELWGILYAAKLGTYIIRNVRGEGGDKGILLRVGSDSDVGRHQTLRGKASVQLTSQQRILRSLFWLRLWSGLSLELFRVPSGLNPADPLSRINSFKSASHARREADTRKSNWSKSPNPFMFLSNLAPTHWQFA